MGLLEKALVQYYKGSRINSKFENNIFETQIRYRHEE